MFASRPRQNITGGGADSDFVAVPGILPGYSLEEVITQCRADARDRWPTIAFKKKDS